MATDAPFVTKTLHAVHPGSLQTLIAVESEGGNVLADLEGLATSVVTVCFEKVNCTSANYSPNDITAQQKSRREKEAIRKRIYHQKMKNERESLRRMVDELSLKLQELQQGKELNSSASSLGIFDSVWKDFVVEERQKLLKSENEQMQLLAAVKAKATCIKEPCKQLPVSLDGNYHVTTGTNSKIAPSIPTAISSPPFDYTMFRGHLRRVNESYTQVDQVFDFDYSDERVFTLVNTRETGGEFEFFEHRRKFTEPFGYEHTQRTLWKLSRLYHRQQDREVFDHVADPEDTIVVRFRLVKSLASGSTVSTLQRCVVRRFVEDDRTIFVWKTHAEGEGAFKEMHSDETGWICIQSSSEKEESTEVLVCIRQAPMSFIISSSSDSRFKEFQEMLQNAVHEDMAEVTHELDKLLLEDTLSGIEL